MVTIAEGIEHEEQADVPAPQRLALRAGLAVRQRAAGRHQPLDARRTDGRRAAPVGRAAARRAAARWAPRGRGDARAVRSATCAALERAGPRRRCRRARAPRCADPAGRPVIGVHSTPGRRAPGPAASPLGRERAGRLATCAVSSRPESVFARAALAVLVGDVVAEPVRHPHALAARSAGQAARPAAGRARGGRSPGRPRRSRRARWSIAHLLGRRLRAYSTQQCTLATTRSAPAARAAVACATIAGTSMRFTDHGLSASTGMPLVP